MAGEFNEEQEEELLQALEGAEHFLVGMSFDPRIPADVKEALTNKASELNGVVRKNV